MSTQDVDDLKARLLLEIHRLESKREQLAERFNIAADSCERLAVALRSNPQYISDPPSLTLRELGHDYRQELKDIESKRLLDDCQEFKQLEAQLEAKRESLAKLR